MQIAKCKLQNEEGRSSGSPWPHRWAVVLACATFPLLWVGGLVTTTDAGMAVPDWPSTYGYNLFLYPWQTWLAGPWDIFVEHGHRLLGAGVGMITIGMLVALWRTEPRAWVRWLGACALGLVVFQGVLGGMRVVLDERTLAMLHGCTGPLFFALSIALVCVTSKGWRTAGLTTDSVQFSAIRSLAVVTCILVYLQIVLGAVLRHVPISTEPATFATAVRFHLFLATILSLHVILLVTTVLRRARHTHPLAGLSSILALLLVVQLTLGAGTWIVKFAVPTWATQWISLGDAAVRDGGWLQTHIITAHVAVGSLLLVTSLALALFALRLLPASAVRQTAIERSRLEAAV
jgi:cytochrome c oxidase assembly protein subunit 15